MNYDFNRRGSGQDPSGYQMLAQGSDDEVDPYDERPRGGYGGGYGDSGRGRDAGRGSSSRGGGKYADDFDDDYDSGRGGRRGSKGYREDDRRGGGRDYDDDYTGCYSGYRGYVRERNAHDGSRSHVVKDEYGVDRTSSNKIKIFVSTRSIRVTDYDNEVVDDIPYTEITKIDHKHDQGKSDGHRNFLAFNLKDGSVFVINSPQTPDIKADVMSAVQRSRSVNIGTYRRNY